MAKIQVLTAITLDGFLPDTTDALMQWVKTDKKGFACWHKKTTVPIMPNAFLDLICRKDEKDSPYTYLAEITDSAATELLRGLFLYNLVDEIVIYLLPLSYGKGTSISNLFPGHHWELIHATNFSNGICRMIYGKACEK